MGEGILLVYGLEVEVRMTDSSRGKVELVVYIFQEVLPGVEWCLRLNPVGFVVALNTTSRSSPLRKSPPRPYSINCGLSKAQLNSAQYPNHETLSPALWWVQVDLPHGLSSSQPWCGPWIWYMTGSIAMHSQLYVAMAADALLLT